MPKDLLFDNTHEVLVAVEIREPQGRILEIQEGDALIIPAGVSHKNYQASEDFKCIGAYPFNVQYDMNYGKACEYAFEPGLFNRSSGSYWLYSLKYIRYINNIMLGNGNELF